MRVSVPKIGFDHTKVSTFRRKNGFVVLKVDLKKDCECIRAFERFYFASMLSKVGASHSCLDALTKNKVK